MSKYLIGADPEFFLYDTKFDIPISAHGLVPGTKEEPHPLKHGACQLDGTAVEFNIDPASTAEEFEHNIHAILDQLRNMIDKRFEFRFTPCVRYPLGYFNKEIPAKSKELGCTPDFISYYLNINYKSAMPPAKQIGTLRTGSGHIHVGWTKGESVTDPDHCYDAMLVSYHMMLLFEALRWAWDSDKDRHTLYGALGAYRPKPYGVEYRGLSNAWLNHPCLWPWLFTTTIKLMEKLEEENEKENKGAATTSVRTRLTQATTSAYYKLYTRDTVQYAQEVAKNFFGKNYFIPVGR